MQYASLISTVSFLIVLGQCSFASENVVVEEEVAIVSVKQRSLQKLFVMGLLTLEQRDYKASIAIFSEILKRTNSPRVRLELARALFLDRQFKAAKLSFQEVLFEEGIPWAVKQNIRLYLNQIDNDIGFIKFGVSFVSDSNPENFTSSEEVSISGRSFKVVRPEGVQEAKGIRYSVNSGFPLSSDSRTQAFLDASFSDFEGGELDRWLGDIGVISSFKQLPKVKAKAGVEYSVKNGKKQYDFSYLSLFYTPNIVNQFDFRYEAKLGRLVVEGASHLDADVYKAATVFTHPLKSGVFLEGGVTLERSIARETPYSYDEGALSLGLDLPVKDWAFNFSGSLGLRLYGDVDPFFGERRRDENKKLGLLLSNKKIHSYGYKPEVGVIYERNDSSLAFFKYDKVSLVFSLKESY